MSTTRVIQVNTRTRNNKWNRQQDRRLGYLISIYGYNWALIAKQFGNKSGKNCRQRWLNQLNPYINRQSWTLEQEWRLYIGVVLYGTKWCELSTMFDARPDKHLKNYWHTTGMKRRCGVFKEILEELFLARGLEQIRRKQSEMF